MLCKIRRGKSKGLAALEIRLRQSFFALVGSVISCLWKSAPLRITFAVCLSTSDDEEGYEPRRRSGRFERNASDRGDGFIQRTTRSFNKTNREESSKQNDDFEPQKRSSRPFSKSRPNSSSDDRRSKPSFGPKKAFSKFGKRPEGKSFSRKKPSKSRFPKKRDD